MVDGKPPPRTLAETVQLIKDRQQQNASLKTIEVLVYQDSVAEARSVVADLEDPLRPFRYLCGLNQQSHRAKCKHNHVDGQIATRFVLGCIRQRLFSTALGARLEQKLRGHR